MAVEWIVTDFADAIDFQEGPGILAKDFHDHGVPLVRLSGLDRGASLLTGCNYLDPDLVAKKWAHFALQKGDILLSTSASLGRIAVVDDEGVGAIAYTGIIRMRPRDERLIAPFIRYLLEGPNFQQQAEAFGSGSVIRHFGPMHLRQMNVLLPPPAEQRAIAHILGTLDDKIELNRRRNQTLEAMARALFKDWFVDFGPVRAKMEGRDGQDGLVSGQRHGGRASGPTDPYLPADLWQLFPDRLDDEGKPEGWVQQRVGDIGAIICGKTPPTKNAEYYGDDVPFITIPEMHGNIFATDVKKRLSHHGAQSQQKKMLPPGSICVSCIATLGLVVITTEPSQTNQQINSVIPHQEDETYFWYWTLKNLGEEIKAGGSGGSVLRNLSTGRFSELRVNASSGPLRLAYNARVENLFSQILAKELESQSLAQLRDTLLPKLISGELRIADTEKFMERVA